METRAASQESETAMELLRTDPGDSNLRRALKATGKGLSWAKRTRAAGQT